MAKAKPRIAPLADWHRADIKAALEKRGLTLAGLDRANALPEGICSRACVYPHALGETVIAAALGLPPMEVWPSRYDADGTRKRPQPAENYRPRLSGRHCLNRKAA